MNFQGSANFTFYLLIYSRLPWAFVAERGLPPVAVCELLIAAASLAVLLGLSSCGTRAELLHGM